MSTKEISASYVAGPFVLRSAIGTAPVTSCPTSCPIGHTSTRYKGPTNGPREPMSGARGASTHTSQQCRHLHISLGLQLICMEGDMASRFMKRTRMIQMNDGQDQGPESVLRNVCALTKMLKNPGSQHQSPSHRQVVAKTKKRKSIATRMR